MTFVEQGGTLAGESYGASGGKRARIQGSGGDRPDFLHRHRGALVIAALWAAFGSFLSAQSYYYRKSVGDTAPLKDVLPADLFYTALWALLTPLILRLGRRFPVERRNWPRRVVAHVVMAIGVSVAQRFVFDLGLAIVRSGLGGPFWTKLGQSVLGTSDYGVFIYFIVLLAGHAIDYTERIRREQAHAMRLEADLATARLNALQTQLQPHFLFNALNSIGALVRSDPAGASRMLARLGQLLRASLEQRDARLVPLERELEALQLYLDVELVRFADRLTVSRDIEPDALRAGVPFLVLQPLVENALRHGIGRFPGPGTIALRASVDGPRLTLEVRNSGDGALHAGADGAQALEYPAAAQAQAYSAAAQAADEARDPGHGLGLANTRARLAALFGDDQAVDLEFLRDGGAAVRLRLPFTRIEEGAPVPEGAR